MPRFFKYHKHTQTLYMTKNTYRLSYINPKIYIISLFNYIEVLWSNFDSLCVFIYRRSLTTVTIPSRLKEIGKSDFIIPQTCVRKSVMPFVLCIYHFSTHRKCQPIDDDQKCVKDIIQHNNTHCHIYTYIEKQKFKTFLKL